MHGRISVSWKREGSRFTLDLVIPAGSNASVYLPTRSAHEISENGASVSNSELIQSNETGSIIKINSGSYHFECPQDI